MVDSQSLKLLQSTVKLNDVITKTISSHLLEKGYTSITPSLLSFLSILECGVNYGSEIARKLDVSRQMVAKTVKALCALGYLEQKSGIGKQKEIHFTEKGERLISDARQMLSDIDSLILNHLNIMQPQYIIQDLTVIAEAIDQHTP
ncbi:winged helix-turn-helix transcriptional regulator [Alteromonas sp. 5E99-2]|nr:winged helix-turn-helix transcriptional regulator [Alteromonas sp. 5E99-2]